MVVYRYDKTPDKSEVGQEAKCPKCGNSFYITGSTCYSCGHG
jgi:ribosomal protein L37E